MEKSLFERAVLDAHADFLAPLGLELVQLRPAGPERYVVLRSRNAEIQFSWEVGSPPWIQVSLPPASGSGGNREYLGLEQLESRVGVVQEPAPEVRGDEQIVHWVLRRIAAVVERLARNGGDDLP